LCDAPGDAEASRRGSDAIPETCEALDAHAVDPVLARAAALLPSLHPVAAQQGRRTAPTAPTAVVGVSVAVMDEDSVRPDWTVVVEGGTIAVGGRTNLVLLDANPLAEIRHTMRIRGVMVRGRWYDRNAWIGCSRSWRRPTGSPTPAGARR
jgi:hypothetical protein